MSTASTVIEQKYEAEDGVVEVARVAPHLDFAWAVLDPGPRRWAPTDLSVESDLDAADGALDVVRMTYRTVGDRVVVVTGARSSVDVDDLAARLAKPLLFAHLRKVHVEASVLQIMAALEPEAKWEASADGGWRVGHAGRGERPVRLYHRSTNRGHLLAAVHGVAPEEAIVLIKGLRMLDDDGTIATELHERHRKALAQRWWDAPRTPWTPKD